MQTRLHTKTVPVYEFETRRCYQANQVQVEALISAGLVAQLVRVCSKADGAIRRVNLKAKSGSIAKPGGQATIVKVLPTTWAHKDSLRLGL